MKRNYGHTGTMDLKNQGRQTPFSGDEEEMMEKAKAAATPGPAHEALGNLVGNWQAEVRCWGGPGGEAQMSTATAKGTWIMNGLFLQEDFSGEMMGRPFNGRTILGYDNVLETFKMVWLSDNQTSLFVADGDGEHDYRLITFEGIGTCPIKGEVRTRVVLRIYNPDRHELEMFDLTDGGSTKTMEINYRRS